MPDYSSQKERLIIQRRRHLVATWRINEGLTLWQIQERLLKQDPPITISIPGVSRDLKWMRHELRQGFVKSGFDAVEVVAFAIRKYENRENTMMAMLKDEKDSSKCAALVRAANDCTANITNILQDVGLLNPQVGRLFFAAREDDGKKVERVPTGEEMQKYFESVHVTEGEIISDAERNWLYGDSTGSTQGQIGGARHPSSEDKADE